MNAPEMTNEERHQMYREAAAVNQINQMLDIGAARTRSMWAVLFSLLLTGLGHVYIGRVGRGAAWFFGGIVLLIATAGFAFPLIWIGAAIDAHHCSKWIH